MSQHDMTLDNGPGVVFRGDANNALKALASQSGGPSAPGVTFPSQLWADTGTGRLKQRNAANSIWLDRGPLDATLRDAASDGTYAADTGTTNAFACSFVPAITVRSESTPLRFKVANGNSGACTINDGFGTAPLVGPTHAALQGGETVASGIALIQWNGSIGGSGAYVLVFCTGAGGQVVNQQLTAFTSAGTAPSFTLTPSPAIQAWTANQRFRVKFHAAGVGSDTINVSGRGPKALKQYDSNGAKVAATIAAGQLADVEYDGTDVVVLDQLPSDLLNTLVANVASAATVDLTSLAPNTRHINITGSVGINGFTVAAGKCYFVRFAGSPLLTNSASLVTQSGADRTPAAGDTCMIRATAANVVEILFYAHGVPQELGYEQTLQDLAGSRAVATTYTNSTGRTIWVHVSFQGNTASGVRLDVLINGVVMLKGAVSGSGYGPNLEFPVPPGSTYRINITLGTQSMSAWSELR